MTSTAALVPARTTIARRGGPAYGAGVNGQGAQLGLAKVIALRQTVLFGELAYEDRCAVGEIAQPVTLGAEETCVREGAPGDALYVVVEGAVRIERGGAVRSTVRAPGVFGEMALLDGAPRTASVVATEATRLLRIPRLEFEALLDESPELVRGVIATLLGYLDG
jgi:CRP-like cAMP-binding protein